MKAWGYSLGMHVLAGTAQLLSVFQTKLKLGIDGRKHTYQTLKAWRDSLSSEDAVVWFHCASLGEFEQGRPVIEEMKRLAPEVKIALTFFSPSGYEIRKNYAQADWVGYLPFDTPKHARDFIDILKPQAAAFVKYEFWANYYFELKRRLIPLVHFSTIFQPHQRFFKTGDTFWKSVLSCVKFYFVQDEQSANLLASIGIHNAEVVGDTRFDRVTEIAAQAKLLAWLTEFKATHPLLVIGSSYSEEEHWALSWLENEPNLRVCVVPHDVDDSRIAQSMKRFEKHSPIRFSELENDANSRVLIVDKIGMLSSIYSQADFVIIGGGFHKGIHNTLEAAVYDVPLFFGPKFQKFNEAHELLAAGAAGTGSTAEEMQTFFQTFAHEKCTSGGKNYVLARTGASKKICQYLLPFVQKK